MASTYSDRLRLELIGSGEQSGTWGTTTNVNIGTLIEEAIAGHATVSMSDANYTLTANSGVSDEARQMIIKLTGTLSASRNVICPTKEKLYVVDNATSGSQSIVFKTSSGSGVTIANGDKVLVFCDGTNVVAGLTNLGAALAPGGGGTGLTAAGTSGNVLRSNGSAWVSAAIIPTGSVMLFYQSAAPTGWTKSTSHNDKALRVVSGSGGGSGGSVAFTTAFATSRAVTVSGSVSTSVGTGTTGGTALTIENIPGHTHYVYTHAGVQASTNADGAGGGDSSTRVNSKTSGATGGSGSSTSGSESISKASSTEHTHSIPALSATSSLSASGTTNVGVNYIDVIICSKDS